MYHVLVAVDGDEDRLSKQLNTLGDFPGRDEIEATVLYVHEEIDAPADEAGRSVIEAINDEIGSLQGVPETVYRATDELEERGILADTATLSGDPASTIVEAAEDIGVDAILVAGRERSPVGKAMFGSVTQGVILNSDRPVVVAK